MYTTNKKGNKLLSFSNVCNRLVELAMYKTFEIGTETRISVYCINAIDEYIGDIVITKISTGDYHVSCAYCSMDTCTVSGLTDAINECYFAYKTHKTDAVKEEKEENTMNIIEKALERTEQENKTAWCIVDEDVNLMTAKHETLESAIDDFVQQIEKKVADVWDNKIQADLRDIQDTIETYGATACLMVFDELDRIRKYKETINCDDLFRMIKEKKEVNTMNVIEKAIATTEKKTRERRHYFATKGKRGISIFCNEYRPDLYIFSTWIARKKWIEEQESSVDIAVMERTATECKQAYSHIVDGVREWDTDVHFM